MKYHFTTLLFVCLFSNFINAQQPYKYYQTNLLKVAKNAQSDELYLNPFTGGINTPILSSIDWNRDGKNDLFIFDKEAGKVLAFMYENAQWVHHPEYESQFPFYLNGWAKIGDFDLDGYEDLITAGFTHNQVTPTPLAEANSTQLFINPGVSTKPFRQHSNSLVDTGFYVGAPYYETFPPSNIISLIGAVPGIDDLDGDGDVDLVTNKDFSTNLMYFENFKNNKYNIIYPKDTQKFVFRDACWGYFTYQFNHSFNLGSNRSSSSDCIIYQWQKKHIDQSLCLIDLNGDGIKDLIFGDSEFKSLISLVNGRLQNSMQADSMVYQDTLFLSTDGTSRKNFIEYPSAYYVDINGDNKKELVVSTAKLNASASVNNFWLYDATRIDGKLSFTTIPGNDFLYKDMLDFGLKSAPTLVDIDADGDDDLVVATAGNLGTSGNNHDRLIWLKNIGTKAEAKFLVVDTNLAQIDVEGQVGYTAAHPTFADLNNDEKPDLILGSANGNLAYYINQTTDQNNPVFALQSKSAFGIQYGSYSTPQLVDFNKDGLFDLVIGCYAGTIAYYQNKGTKLAPAFDSLPTIDKLGKIDSREVFYTVGRPPQTDVLGYSAPTVTDIEGDGVWEIIVGNSSGRVYFYTNAVPVADSAFTLIDSVSVEFDLPEYKHYNKRFAGRSVITTGHFDGDAKQDLIIGGISGGLTFLGSKNPRVGLNNKNLTDDIGFKVFPNPVSHLLNMSFNQPIYIKEVNVLNLLGEVVLFKGVDRKISSTQLDLSALPNGIYILHLSTEAGLITQKIAVNKP